ncbi:cytochrome c oxidase subunit I [Terriglobus saanensis]|uniref:Cytochrome c oxidase subunit I n=1 Tax=Terriglobus saanensis (strain ATCC BAA-1853 / DSM 23119 / SP1PR4) TaxID=401053 RepID=E8V6P2_TERSS|nr:cbb3-type cytochrome c oxidase subunit I [Terriglobus saanensis]ADV82781.1 cytochrome c oxidase subunit I [Terriglobus saanensis SP1PR4]
MKIFSTHHRTIGIGYLLLAGTSVAIGTLLSLLMRVHRVWPDLNWPLWGIMKPEDYLATVTMHGTLMVFFVLTTAPQSGFSNLVLPEQIGSRTMALPWLNAASFWTTVASLLVLLSAFFVRGGGPISGWTSYPPFSALADTGPGQATGMDLWLVSIGLFCIASTMSGANTLVTVVRCRCKGMTWGRMPLTVWAWFTAALLTVIVFSVLFAAALLLLCDRHAGTSFFVPAGGVINGVVDTQHGDGSPLLWLHLFWFFGHPEVYIAILPGMGMTSMLLANFCRRGVPAYRWMITTTLLIGLLGLSVWGHHMFVAGLNPWAGTVFQLTTIAIAIPSTAKVLNWLVTLWGSRPTYTTPMLWSLGFVSLFVAGGVTGPVLAQPALDAYLHNTFFVVAHFHLVMAMAGVFSIFAGLTYWFPLIAGRRLDERLGKIHFWWTLLFAYCTFLPMHISGLMGEPRHGAQLTGVAAGPAGELLHRVWGVERHITYNAIMLALGQIFFFWNLQKSLRKPRSMEENPWEATTMEWAPMTDEEQICHRAPCVYIDGVSVPQWVAAVE